jgi:lysine 2,3-aminomutase
VARVCKSLLSRGMPLNNHSVLLKGVNDDLATMRRLVRAMLRVKIRPYLLFHCDPVIGAGHFRTSVWKGMELIEGLRGHLSGLAIPTYVVDAPHGGGKIPLMPNYLVSASDDCVILRNYEGMLVRYQAEDKPTTIEPTANRGVSQLIQGTKTAIVPRESERLERRRQYLQNKVHGDGCSHEEEGEGEERLASLPVVAE